MEQVNNQEAFNQLISGYLDNQSDLPAIDSSQLAMLIEKYPFCQPLYLISAAIRKENEGDQSLALAAAYISEREILYKALRHPGSLQRTVITREWKAAPEPEPKPAFAASVDGEEEEEEELLTETIASHDFFQFERMAAAPLPAEKPVQPAREEPNVESAATPKPTEISRYDDDQLPYTFLWWLSKTRNEHAHTFQPYASPLAPPRAEEKKNDRGELNHQILENIFHLKNQVEGPAYAESTRTVPFEVKHKEDRIIERFIREDPQIKPLQAEKIDNENKARKSSEDPNDLVSETLARIYADQLLYHKAADTYRKLRLKFPEKSAYFADQIRELERKV